MPSIAPIDLKATKEQRLEAFFQWCERSQQMNPQHMLPLGVVKRWYHIFKREHPFTRKYKRPT